nr:pyruvate kinase [Propionibacterium sp.]
MMDRASTGIAGLDETIDGLRLGDNVVWQVDSVADFEAVVAPFVDQARRDARQLVYLRFGLREPLLADLSGVDVRLIDPSVGFERFAMAVREALTDIGPRGFYVFDPLTDLHHFWQSDLMVLNFFKAHCPYLYELDTIAYFTLLRREHTTATVAGIRATTQLLLDLHRIDDQLYVHPLKVWKRHSPTMFFPHLLSGGEAISITSSEATTRLFASLARRREVPDPWQRRVDEAWAALTGPAESQRSARDRLLAMMIGQQGRMVELCRKHLQLTDLLAVASRLIGTGSVGGKAVGMLLARAILEHDPQRRFAGRLEPHDSFFLGADLFVTFLVANDWWTLWTDHKRDEHYFSAASDLHRLIPGGEFPRAVSEEFLQLLEYFGQSPIIVRSSSLLEDNYGNAFAGKYDSVFCANQGDPSARLAAFEDAVRTVYASAVSPEALRYRADRGLAGLDEQMAILVQRVSGDVFGDMFFPPVAGVANSSSLYVWDAAQADQGMVRLVVGLGTRAVDRADTDFARIVSLANPTRSPLKSEELARYSQRRVDALDLAANRFTTIPLAEARRLTGRLDWSLQVSPDREAERRRRELGRGGPVPDVVDFAGLLGATSFPDTLREILATLSAAYDYPVDVEFTVNVDHGDLRINIVQCRPLQTRGVGAAVAAPTVDPDRCLLSTSGSFMGGNARLPLEYVVLVRPEAYLALGESARYSVARLIGRLNRLLDGAPVLLIGPGRWGSSMASLGVPAHFTELNRFAVLCEHTYAEGDFRPELSYGSHFFQELVESGIFYVALFDDRPGVLFQPRLALERPNLLPLLEPDAGALGEVVHVAAVPGLVLHANVVTQRLVVQFEAAEAAEA